MKLIEFVILMVLLAIAMFSGVMWYAAKNHRELYMHFFAREEVKAFQIVIDNIDKFSLLDCNNVCYKKTYAATINNDIYFIYFWYNGDVSVHKDNNCVVSNWCVDFTNAIKEALGE